ncbi:protein of unknown function DUF989 [Gemmatirosa kalamazoonensis]|uniref:Cytochrome c domain-containing protein n=1 Tax=Gemmatirosa kalamazoonensis TaxID=861299 RepID=W0RH97_9BACT|nr:urate hydroxylase PuuD [Gemmatirosa kalamazoonensis]AHG89685.1 protein of unknown function DUF989 [Gemmatirosa kalamazoonensis]
MTPRIWELLDLVARWVHVVAGIMWVGNSLLFNWLDRSLQKRAVSGMTREPLGTIWLLHSGGFYYVEKTLLAGEPLPTPLHWFKWQAYTTWLSGVALLVVVYWAGGRAVMADPSVHGISQLHATALAIAGLVLGWGLYEGVQRLVAPRAPRVAAAAWTAGLILVAIAFTNHLSGRAAFLHVGAMLATIMAGNVFLTIVPSQRALVASVRSGGAGAELAALSARAKRVSIHNNYFTFPVIALMVSNHFPALYAGRWSWLVLLILVAGGAAVRHVLNVRWTWPGWRPALAGTIATTIAALWAVLSIPAPPVESTIAPSRMSVAGPVTFADARHVIDRRCAVCHSMSPVDSSLGVAPAGVAFDTPEEIVARAARIRERAVVTRTMPPANRTHMTDEERAVLARWIDYGGRVR